jgi:CRISPR-associated protein Csm2
MPTKHHQSGSGQKWSEEREDFDMKQFKDRYKSWIQSEFDADTIEFAEQFGTFLVKSRMTTSQIRNIYGEVKRIESKIGDKEKGFTKEVYKDFLLLKPKLAYAAKRAGTRGIEKFKEVMDSAHLAVVEAPESARVDAFCNFTDLFEAILAYHKAAGGRE